MKGPFEMAVSFISVNNGRKVASRFDHFNINSLYHLASSEIWRHLGVIEITLYKKKDKDQIFFVAPSGGALAQPSFDARGKSPHFFCSPAQGIFMERSLDWTGCLRFCFATALPMPAWLLGQRGNHFINMRLPFHEKRQMLLDSMNLPTSL